MQMNLYFEPTERDLVAQFRGSTGETYQLLFYGLVDRALEILGRPRKDLKGSIILESNLPLGNGLGASAALCVVVGRWLADLGWVDVSKLESFCRELENLFHGESSGVDVAVVLSGCPLCFSRFAPSIALDIQWKPKFYLSASGQKGLTHACVQQVKEFLGANPVVGQSLDQAMSDAVESMCALLTRASDSDRDKEIKLVEAINKARQSFEAWGLTEGVVEREMRQLMDAGALAVKPTGSGGGGYILSYWKEDPPELLRSKLISCW
jgi:mevalonate kinase